MKVYNIIYASYYLYLKFKYTLLFIYSRKLEIGIIICLMCALCKIFKKNFLDQNCITIILFLIFIVSNILKLTTFYILLIYIGIFIFC